MIGREFDKQILQEPKLDGDTSEVGWQTYSFSIAAGVIITNRGLEEVKHTSVLGHKSKRSLTRLSARSRSAAFPSGNMRRNKSPTFFCLYRKLRFLDSWSSSLRSNCHQGLDLPCCVYLPLLFHSCDTGLTSRVQDILLFQDQPLAISVPTPKKILPVIVQHNRNTGPGGGVGVEVTLKPWERESSSIWDQNWNL